MWYFSWILGVGLACTFGILNAIWYEFRVSGLASGEPGRAIVITSGTQPNAERPMSSKASPVCAPDYPVNKRIGLWSAITVTTAAVLFGSLNRQGHFLMTVPLRTILSCLVLSLPLPVLAQDASLTFGGDQYTASQDAAISTPVTGDAFIAGYDVKLSAPVAGDAHLAGFNVSINSDVTGDLYAAGYSVSIDGAVGGDLTAAANSIVVRSTTPMGGNLRLSAGNVTLSTPTSGSALISAQTLNLDATIDGDLNFLGENLVFGPKALVTGRVLIHAPKEIAVPLTVAAADRVTYEQLSSPDYMSEAGRTAENVVRGFWPQFWGAAAWRLALVLVGAAFIAFMPRGIAAMETISAKRPFQTFGIGILAFAAVLGLTPLLILTIVGILLLPIVLVFALIASSLAFLAGSYVIGVGLVRRFLTVETNLHRAAVLAVTMVTTALLSMIPFVGWPITLTIVIFGFGVVAIWLSGSRVNRARRLGPEVPVGPLATAPAV